MPPPEQVPDCPVLRLPCVDQARAAELADLLRAQNYDVRAVEDRTVIVPTDSPGFVFRLCEIAEELEFAREPDVSTAIGVFLAALEAARPPDPEFDALLDASSVGTPEARALQAQTPPKVMLRLLASLNPTTGQDKE